MTRRLARKRGGLYDGSVIGERHFADCLCDLYFERNRGILRFGRYIERAYRDFARTLHGFASKPERSAVLDCARHYLSGQLSALVDGVTVIKHQADFDRWHDQTCEHIRDVLGPERVAYGQAQKWVNMTIKYLFVAGGVGVESVGGLAACYRYAHLPIDNIMLKKIEEIPGPTVGRPWSKLSRDLYIRFQHEVREAFKECPLDVELMLYHNKGQPTRA